MKYSEISFLVLFFFLFSCGKKPEQKETLFNLLSSEQTGIDFANNLESTAELNILEYLYFYNGGGVAAGDIDNDGLVDLYFTGNQVPNKLYLNQGKFKFKDITADAGVDGADGWSTGVTMADVNGDGLLDIYVCQVGEIGTKTGKNKLYLNLGDGKFKESAAEFGIDFKGYSTQAVFFDYDRDGDLDLYLLNHNIKSPEVFSKAENRKTPDPLGDKLFKNLLVEGGTGFEDITEQAGIYSSILGFGLGVAVEDFNGDGWLDLYVSNDFTENDYLYLNNQNGTFRESLEELIASTSRYSMGNDAADLNGDGRPEIFTTDMLPADPEIWMKSVGEDKAEVYQIKKKYGYGDQYVRNHLQLNRGQGQFSEIALYSGVAASDWSWSPLIFDMDNDGLPDIHVTNGIVKRPNDLDFIQYSQNVDASASWEEIRENQIRLLPSLKIANFAWKNEGDLSFENQAEAWGLDQKTYSNGSTYADLDNDGDLDLVINNLDERAFLYENKAEKNGNYFLRVKLSADAPNTFGIGTKLTLYAGEMQFSQRLTSTRGFESGTSTTLVFGLGKSNQLDSILVAWPMGQQEIFPTVPANQEIILTQGKGRTFRSTSTNSPSSSEFIEIPWQHQELDEIDFLKLEYLAPKSFTHQGPAVAVADVNGDGLEDLYLGGAKNQSGAIFLQNTLGGFDEFPNPIFAQFSKAEDAVAEFADLNGDGAQDLIIGSAGNEYKSGTLFNFDRILFGDGTGKFTFSMNSLPPFGENTASFALADIDGDGDLDLFVGTSVKNGDYGANPKSSLLINQGSGHFVDQTEIWFGKDFEFGMINTAQFADLNGNGKMELIFSGDWNPIRVFELQGGKATEIKPSGLENSAGWIHALEVADVNGDGTMDLITGNLGLNSKLKASPERPVWLYHYDFDGNGQADPLIFHYMGEKLVPFGTRDDLIRQIPGVKKKHSGYAEYAKISRPEDLFPTEEIQKARKLAATEFRSGVHFQQMDGSFVFEPFPKEAQWSPIQSLAFDPDSKKIILGSNSSDFRVDLGKSLNSPLLTVFWEGKWNLEPIQVNSSPDFFGAEINHAKKIKLGTKSYFLFTENNGRAFLIP